MKGAKVRIKKISLFIALVLLGKLISREGIAQTPDFQQSPFGFHPASVNAPGYPDNGFVDAQNLGVRWHRPTVYAFWFVIQPNLNDTTYDWSLHDRQYGEVPNGIHILANITADHPRNPHGYALPGSYLPIDESKYAAFVRATVERYDGDGLEDMPGLMNPIKFWQVDNEPRAELSGFADLQRMTYQAIKQACSECTVLIGGAAGFPDNYVRQFDAVYLQILAQLAPLDNFARSATGSQSALSNEVAGQYVDVFDFHWYGMAAGDYRLRDSVTGEDVYQHVRSVLTANGFPPDLPIWITEMGSYSGDPAEPRFPFQNERQQASDYFKRFVYSLSRGVKKIFPAFGLMEGFIHNDGYFDHTGLIYDGRGSNDLGLGIKKLGYYTYKKMTEILEGSDWDNIQITQEGNGIYIYKFTPLDSSGHLTGFTKQGQPLWVAWKDGSDTRTITISGITSNQVKTTEAVPKYESGKEVADYTTAFRADTPAVANGAVTLTLGERPVFIEPLPVTSVGAKPENVPQEFRLYQNYPNPFRSGATSPASGGGNPSTVISFLLPVNSHVTLKVFDLNGREVAILVDGEMAAGEHTVPFAPRDLAGGLYFYKLTAGKFSQTRKAVVMK